MPERESLAACHDLDPACEPRKELVMARLLRVLLELRVLRGVRAAHVHHVDMGTHPVRLGLVKAPLCAPVAGKRRRRRPPRGKFLCPLLLDAGVLRSCKGFSLRHERGGV